jgi:anti-sigma-K factor RskA
MKHTQLTDDLQEQASLYAAGAMTDGERREYARHLEEDQCEVCQSEVDELQAAMSMLAFTVPQARPSPSVKARLMEQAAMNAPRRAVVEVEPTFRWFNWITAAIAVASIAVTFFVLRTNNELRRELAEQFEKIARLEDQLTGVRRNIALLTSPSVRLRELAGQGANMQASAKIFWDLQQKRWRVYVSDLPPLPADKSYQLWFVTKSGRKVSAKVFNTDANGAYEVEVPVPDDVVDLQAAAVTTEPFGGVPQPTGSFALLGMM